MDLFNKFFIILIFLLFGCTSVYSATGEENYIGVMTKKFTRENLPAEFSVKSEHAHVLPSDVIIPKNSIMTFKIVKVQKERRWHKGGYIICKLKDYKTENQFVDMSDKNYYVYIKKYEPVIPKDAVILGTEIALTQGADFFAPGSSFGYYFIKGAIIREYDKNWAKAGFLEFYNNSLFWFWFHGKPIEIEENGLVEAKYIDELRADSLIYLSQKYDAKYKYKQDKKTRRNELKTSKKEFKSKYKILKASYKKKNNTEITKEDLKNTKKEFNISYKTRKNEIKGLNKISKAECKQLRKELKNEHNVVHKKLQNEAKITKKELKIRNKQIDKKTKKENKKNKKEVRKELKTEVKALKASYVAKLKQDKKENKLRKKEERIKRKIERKELKAKKKAEKARIKAEKRQKKS